MLLGLDIGTKRTGVAISAGIYAHEYTTLGNTQELAQQLATICQKEGITKIVVGLPYNVDGTPSAQTQWAQTVVDRLKEGLKLPVETVDEVLTTAEARRVLTEMRLTSEVIEQRIDQAAAQLILQQYIDSHRDEVE